MYRVLGVSTEAACLTMGYTAMRTPLWTELWQVKTTSNLSRIRTQLWSVDRFPIVIRDWLEAVAPSTCLISPERSIRQHVNHPGEHTSPVWPVPAHHYEVREFLSEPSPSQECSVIVSLSLDCNVSSDAGSWPELSSVLWDKTILFTGLLADRSKMCSAVFSQWPHRTERWQKAEL